MAIAGTTETLRTDVFAANGQTYDPATVVLFSQAT
jgi:predicted metalloprotease